jgi:hypothetical protein
MTRIARLRITLDDVTPPVTRLVEVPLSIRLDDLHLVIQAAMGWENYHLYEFRLDDMAWGIPDPDGVFTDDDPLPAKKATVADLVVDRSATELQYAYDFGDGWEHTVSVEAIAEMAPDALYPRLVTAEGQCPPEDVGGPWGYAEYLEAINDPKHERHDEMIEWRGPGFDPTAVDKAAIAKELSALAKRFSRRKRRAAK